MLTAERRARHAGHLVRPGGRPMVAEEATTLEPADGIRHRAVAGLLPILTFVGVVFFEIARVGGAFSMPASELWTIEGLTGVLYDGSGSRPLLLGAVAGFLVAVVFAAGMGLARDIPRAAWTTLRSMGVAIAILYLAWMIGAVCRDLGTASYLAVLLGDRLDPLVLPSLLFVLAGVVAFSTGSSWSTMTILLPLVVGLAFGLGETTELGGHALMILSIGAVLEGAIFGDHCSPISDTTVMSSVATASDHIDHVRTQAPYAGLAMVVALVAGYLPCAYLGTSPWIGLAAGTLVLAAIVLLLGRSADQPAAEPPALP